MTPIRVVVVDDHAVFREGIRSLLGRIDDIVAVGEAATTEQAVALTLEMAPDVVLMDLNIPGGGGEEATAQILARLPDTRVLVLTMHADTSHLRRALEAGAHGYLVKDADPDAIVHSIVNVADGNIVLGADVGRHLLTTTSALPQRPFPTLTPREFEILDRLARGLANGVIAARMGISVKTVQNSVSGILLKLGVADRGQAVAVARDAGLGVSPR